MLKQKAHSLEDAVPNLDPTRALTVQELDRFYVEREEISNLLGEMQVQLELQYPCKGLLTGHRGSGKSSTLARLGRTLNERNRLWVVHFSILDGLDLNDLNYVDLVLLMAVKILEACKDDGLNLKGYDQRLQAWVSDIEIIKEEQESLGITSEAGAEASTPSQLGWLTLPVKALLSIGAKVGKESSTRKIIRDQIESDFQELLGIIDDLQQAIFELTDKRLICLIDGADKASIESAENLFYKNGSYLSAPECSIIYTFPVALYHSNEFNQIKAYFSESFDLPNYKVQHGKEPHEDSQPKGIYELKQIIARCVNTELFEEAALTNLVYASGGIPRTAILLTQKACIKALVKRAAKVDGDHADAAVADEQRDFDRQLTQKQRELLKLVHNTKDIDSDPDKGYLDLLHNLSVIEYINGDVWYGVSPLVLPLLAEDS
ncbi:MAG: hypothetical protein AAF708_02400 [Deinococcota bacterium]